MMVESVYECAHSNQGALSMGDNVEVTHGSYDESSYMLAREPDRYLVNFPNHKLGHSHDLALPEDISETINVRTREVSSYEPLREAHDIKDLFLPKKASQPFMHKFMGLWILGEEFDNKPHIS